MKKALVLVALASLVATQALAFSIVNSKHDLSSQSTTAKKGDYNEICVYCHTPHGARLAGTPNTLPLWNRSATGMTFTASDLYNSVTLDPASQPNVVSTYVARSDAALCMSCHDGTTLAKPVTNPPNSNPSGAGATSITLSANANLSPDLKNDHPIGMVYATIQTNDTAGFNANPSGIDFYDGGRMWCSSCHDVHDPGVNVSTSATQFMATTMYGSLLCLKCHNK